MSTKKDKFSLKDKFYMEIALDLAKSRHGHTGSNPSVGCVIVKNDKIISIGQTSFNGRPHAEFNAINNSFEDLKGSKMYVSLEPCTHYGKTPPCSNIIIKSQIKEVIFPIVDVDDITKGKSFNPSITIVPIVFVDISPCPSSSRDLEILLMNFSIVAVSIGPFFRAI